MLLGEHFKERLERQIALSDIVLVMIGPYWLEIDPKSSTRRIDHPDDSVRFEVASALRRGLFVLPILIDGAKLPAESDLPRDIQALVWRHCISLTSQEFNRDVQPLLQRIKDLSPGRVEALLHWFIDRPTYIVLLSLMILSALTLFAAVTLSIGILDARITIEIEVSNIAPLKNESITKEVGYFLALNWSAFILPFMPISVFLLHATMQEGNSLITEINFKKMLVYIDHDGHRVPRRANELWALIIRVTALFTLIMAALTFILGVWQWYKYSGQWFIRGYEEKTFLDVSTGPDWQVGWALRKSLEGSGLAITIFALWNYLFYGFGWALTFGYYIFVLILTTELQQVAQSVGPSRTYTLQVSSAERDTGGFGSLASIQRYLGWFCAVAVLNMITMSLRNTYLPLHCIAPLPDKVPPHCTSMQGFIEEMLWSDYSVMKDLVLGNGFDILPLFFIYTAPNDFTIGPLLNILLYACLFLFISNKTRRIVEAAHANTSEAPVDIGRPLIRELAVNGRLTVVMIMTGAMVTFFPNILFIYAILFAVFWIVQVFRRPLSVTK
jgi:hypothetical protein